MSQSTPGAPRPIGASLDRLLGHLEAPSLDALSVIFGQWPDVVGPDVAAHSQPTAIDGSTLVVSAQDSVWAREIQWLESEVVSRIKELTNSDQITALKVRVRPS